MPTVSSRVAEIMEGDFALVAERFPDAKTFALGAYSNISPLILSKVCPVNATTLTVELPSEWVQGFSTPRFLLDEEVANIESGGVTVLFTAEDWVPSGANTYQLTAIHNLESYNLLVQFIDENNNGTSTPFDVATANSISLFSNNRFAGRVLIKRV